jgi:hypothetical protein
VAIFSGIVMVVAALSIFCQNTKIKAPLILVRWGRAVVSRPWLKSSIIIGLTGFLALYLIALLQLNLGREVIGC